MSEKKNVALVFGASGISGWSVTKDCLSYPSTDTFSRVIGLTNRPRSSKECGLPEDERLEIHSGINLRGSLEEVLKEMKEKIPHIEEVTHMYYCAYSNATSYSLDVMEIKNINTAMTYNAIHATDQLCSSLKFIVLQTGTNNYGVAVMKHMDKIEINPPLKEDNPRIPSPYGDEIFYYAQVDLIREAAKGKQWGWCEVRPDVINGYVPTETGMTFLEPVLLYLALYRYVNGPDASVPFPGTQKTFTHSNTDSSQGIISKSEIYLSVVKPNEANGEAFNIADTATPETWSTRWPRLAGYYGLKGTGPATDGWGDIDKWWNEHQAEYKKMCAEYGLREREITEPSWVFIKFGFTALDRNREVSLDKIRSIGFTEELPVGQGHIVAMDRMEEAHILPPKGFASKDLAKPSQGLLSSIKRLVKKCFCIA